MRTKIASDLTSLLDVVLVILFAFIFLHVEREQATAEIKEDLVAVNESIKEKEGENNALKEEVEELKRRLEVQKDLATEIQKAGIEAVLEGRFITMELETLETKNDEGYQEWKLYVFYKENEIATLESNAIESMSDDLAQALAKAEIKPDFLTCLYTFKGWEPGTARAKTEIKKILAKVKKQTKGYDLRFIELPKRGGENRK